VDSALAMKRKRKRKICAAEFSGFCTNVSNEEKREDDR
jgi:hypothetical protein